MDLHTQGLDVVCAICSSSKVRQIELNLVPAFVQSHWHSTDEGLHPCSALIIRCSEATSNLLVIQYCDLESEVFLQILDDHDKKRELDA